jgi:Uma2 family endonuclease
VGQLYRILADHVEARDLGTVFIAPYDVVLSDTTVCQPDILFVSKERMALVTRENLRGAPDLAVEVLSENQKNDRVVKLRLYEEAAVAHYWLAHPEDKTLEEFVRDAGTGKFQARELLELADGTFIPAVFPDLTIDLAKLFR